MYDKMATVSCLACFRPQVLGVGHVTGHVTVWRLSSKLVNQQLNEMRALEDLVSQTLSI